MEWINISSPGAIKRNKKAFLLSHNKLSVIITNDHIKYPNNWVLNCPPLGLVNIVLKTDIKDEIAAKLEAVESLYKTSCENMETTRIMASTIKEMLCG